MGYRKVSLREEAYRVLEEAKRLNGLSSLSDAVILLAERAELCSVLEKRLEELLAVCRTVYRKTR